MKKSVLFIAVVVVLSISFSSCGSNKPPCPAYRAQADVEMPADKV